MNLLDRSPDAAVTAELQRLADETVRFVAQISRRLAALEPYLKDTSPGASARPIATLRCSVRLRIAFILIGLFLAALLGSPAMAQGRLADFLKAVPPSELVSGADRFGDPEGTLPLAPIFANDSLLGFVYPNSTSWMRPAFRQAHPHPRCARSGGYPRREDGRASRTHRPHRHPGREDQTGHRAFPWRRRPRARRRMHRPPAVRRSSAARQSRFWSSATASSARPSRSCRRAGSARRPARFRQQRPAPRRSTRPRARSSIGRP